MNLTPGEIVTLVLLAVGVLFCLLAALGILVMNDLYNRMQAASKAVTLGAVCVVLGAAVHFGDSAVAVRCLLVCVFLFVTVPVASHLIGRAAHRSNEPLAPETVMDELSEAEEKTCELPPPSER
jgi:multicomponent Na+:H+ antiporter subunit G